ncbi:hypothetical protein NKG05_24620 [Oerskovia sp. M15]
MPTSVPALAAADAARLRTRAARHARSSLAASGLAVLVVTGLSMLGTAWLWLVVLVPLVAFVLAYVTAFALRFPTGVGVGSDGYGIVVVLCALIAFLVPLVAFWFGVPFVAGLGLAVLGLRASDRVLWVSGAATMAASFVLVSAGARSSNRPSRPHSGFALGVALLVVAVFAFRGERETLAAATAC